MVVLIVVAVAAMLAVVLVGLRVAASSGAPLEVDAEENWLLSHAPSWMQRALRTLDRRVVGGVAVGASFVVVFASAAVVGWIFSGLDNQRGIARWDVAAAEYGRDNATPRSTDVLEAVTDLGGTQYVLALMVLVGVYHSVRRDNWGALLYLGVVGVGVTALNNGLKLIVDRDRPDFAQLAGHAGSSFPSGHSAAAAACWAAMALVIARRQTRRVRIAAAVVAVFVAGAVATTRVLLGVHWLSDVVAGVIVGWSWFFVVTIVFGGRLLRFGEPAERIANSPSVLPPQQEPSRS